MCLKYVCVSMTWHDLPVMTKFGFNWFKFDIYEFEIDTKLSRPKEQQCCYLKSKHVEAIDM